LCNRLGWFGVGGADIQWPFMDNNSFGFAN